MPHLCVRTSTCVALPVRAQQGQEWVIRLAPTVVTSAIPVEFMPEA